MYRIVWSPKARVSHLALLDYLYRFWGKVGVNNFEEKLEKIQSSIQSQPEGFRLSEKVPNVRIAPVTKHTSLAYHVIGDVIEIVSVQDNRRNPKTLKY